MKSKKYCICNRHIWLAFLIVLFVFALFPTRAKAAKIKVKGQLTNQTTYKLTLKESKQVTHWRIRMGISNDNGDIKYKKVKILKASKKTYTLKNLKKDTYYCFEISGCVKKNGKWKGLIYDYADCFTGMSGASWDDYAASDPSCSPESITLMGYCCDDGLKISGFEIYRREDGCDQWELFSTTGKKAFPYVDKKVEAGKTYYYRLRTFGTYKGETLYSPYSEELCRSAVNQSGVYTSTVVSRDKDQIILKMESKQYNSILKLRSSSCIELGKNSQEIEDMNGIPLTIEAVSADGESWMTLKKDEEFKIKGGESLYLRLKAAKSGKDLSKGKVIGGDGVEYNNLPSIFLLTLGGEGSAYMDLERIH